MNESTHVADLVAATMERPRGAVSPVQILGTVVAELHGPDGALKGYCKTHNLVTAVGDQLYAARGSGIASPPAAPTGMRLGTGSTAVAKTGAGAAIVTKITGGNVALDSGFPTAAAGVATYKCTFGAGVGTTASPVTEVVLVNDTIATDTATAAANTVARALLTGIGSKAAADTLTVTWTQTILGA